MYSDFIFDIALAMNFIVASYFFIILLFSTGYRVHSFIIIAGVLLFMVMPSGDFIKGINTAILIDGITAFTLTMFLFIDKLAWKQALILCFATLCHIMIIYDLTIASTWFSVFFYNYYDELIITVGLTQMAVSYDGINTALRNIREFIFRVSLHSWGYSKSNTSFKIREKGT